MIEPIPMKKGDPRVLINGTPCEEDFRIISENLYQALIKLEAFKEYVHKRLDALGVPTDPEPEKNKEHGCRIEGRLNYFEGLETAYEKLKKENEALRKRSSEFHGDDGDL